MIAAARARVVPRGDEAAIFLRPSAHVRVHPLRAGLSAHAAAGRSPARKKENAMQYAATIHSRTRAPERGPRRAAIAPTLLLPVGLLAACGPAGTPDVGDVSVEKSPQEDVAEEMTDHPAAGAGEPRGHWEVDGLTITAMEDSPTYPDASLSLAAPEAAAELPSGEPVAFDFEVSGFELGAQTEGADEQGLANSENGQHIHLILGTRPYSAHYEADFEQRVEPGYHVALAFLSRSWHESVKTPEASLVRELFVGTTPEEVERADLDAPHLFYSRPKGTYTGEDTERVMLDFYLVNADLSPDGYKVRATIDDRSVTFTRWVPYVIEGLPMGEVTIQLELLDENDELVDSPLNPVVRKVMLAAEAEEVM